MRTHTTLTRLLEEAAGPPPRPGDLPDVHRRARRHVRRRRAGLTATLAATVVALLVPALGVALRSPGGPEDVTTGAGRGGEVVGEVLFERELRGGGTLRVSETGVPGQVEVEWPGTPEPILLTPWSASDEQQQGLPYLAGVPMGSNDDPGWLYESLQAPQPAPGSKEPVSLGESLTSRSGWALYSFAACPGHPAAELWLRASGDDAQTDSMALVDGLAIVAVPYTRDADGSLGFSWGVRDEVGEGLSVDFTGLSYGGYPELTCDGAGAGDANGAGGG